MRISDWSSDVCSSDLPQQGRGRKRPRAARGDGGLAVDQPDGRAHGAIGEDRQPDAVERHAVAAGYSAPVGRSEEHTSELQSLMRISYAVLCLQKKNYYNTPYRILRQSITLVHL